MVMAGRFFRSPCPWLHGRGLLIDSRWSACFLRLRLEGHAALGTLAWLLLSDFGMHGTNIGGRRCRLAEIRVDRLGHSAGRIVVPAESIGKRDLRRVLRGGRKLRHVTHLPSLAACAEDRP